MTRNELNNKLSDVLEAINESFGRWQDSGGAGEHIDAALLEQKVVEFYGLLKNIGKATSEEAVPNQEQEVSQQAHALHRELTGSMLMEMEERISQRLLTKIDEVSAQPPEPQAPATPQRTPEIQPQPKPEQPKPEDPKPPTQPVPEPDPLPTPERPSVPEPEPDPTPTPAPKPEPTPPTPQPTAKNEQPPAEPATPPADEHKPEPEPPRQEEAAPAPPPAPKPEPEKPAASTPPAPPVDVPEETQREEKATGQEEQHVVPNISDQPDREVKVEAPEERPQTPAEEQPPTPKRTSLNDRFAGGKTSLHERLKRQQQGLADRYKQKPVTDLKSAISINQKMAFINDLFDGNQKAYKKAIETLNKSGTMSEAKFYLQSELKPKYNWSDEDPLYQNLFTLVIRKFS